VKPIVYVGHIIQLSVLVKDSSGNILPKAVLNANVKSSRTLIESFTNSNLDEVIFELGSGRKKYFEIV
jgi:hypothetical protein